MMMGVRSCVRVLQHAALIVARPRVMGTSAVAAARRGVVAATAAARSSPVSLAALHRRALHTTPAALKKKAKGGHGGKGGKTHRPAMTFDPETAPVDVKRMEEQFASSEEALAAELGKIRTGQVSPALLDGIPHVRQAGQVSVKNANTLLLTTFDQDSAQKAFQAIKDSGIAQNPVKNGMEIEIVLPKMTTEYKSKLQKLAKDILEKYKHQARNIRNKYVAQLKKSDATKDDKRHIETYIQQCMDGHLRTMDAAYEAKHKALSS